MRTLAIANQKGGTGKTATAHNVGVILAQRRRLLLVDTDPQGSLTSAVLTDPPRVGLANVYRGAKIADAIHHAGKVDIIPADIALASVELELVSKIGRENLLKRSLAPLDYDLCIIDCPPSLSLLTVNALTASHGVIIPTQPQAQDLRGLSLFLETIKQIQQELNPDLEVIGILPTFYDPRLNHHREAIEAMKAAKLPLMKVHIRRSVRIAEAAGLSQSLMEYAPAHPQNESYKSLSEVIIKWLRSKQ